MKRRNERERKGGRNGKEKEIKWKKQTGNPLTLNFEPILVAKKLRVEKHRADIFKISKVSS